MRLSRLLYQYDRDGYCIQPEVFSSKDCAALIAAARELPEFKKGDTRPAMMPHRTEKIFLDALKHPTIVTMMERLLSGKVSGLQTEFFYCAPGTKGFSNHQDNFFVEAPEDAFASAWIA